MKQNVNKINTNIKPNIIMAVIREV